MELHFHAPQCLQYEILVHKNDIAVRAMPFLKWKLLPFHQGFVDFSHGTWHCCYLPETFTTMRCSNCSDRRDDATSEHSCYCHLAVKIWIISAIVRYDLLHIPQVLTTSHTRISRVQTPDSSVLFRKMNAHTHHRTSANLRWQKLWKIKFSTSFTKQLSNS
jgi:hypothetical protein